MPLRRDELTRIVRTIKKTFPEAKKIIVENAVEPAFGRSISHNHFHIELPATSAELEQRLSSKGRYNLRREKRILTERFGNYEINHYKTQAPGIGKVWDFYFTMKENTYGTVYNLDETEYCKKYHVTDLYTLTLGEDNQIGSVILSCEQCPMVYLENLTYDQELAEFSPGQVLYDEYLKMLVSKRAKGVILLGGKYSYKKRYGSVENQVYNCTIYRNSFINTEKWAERKLRDIGHLIKEQLENWRKR